MPVPKLLRCVPVPFRWIRRDHIRTARATLSEAWHRNLHVNETLVIDAGQERTEPRRVIMPSKYRSD